MYNKERFKMSYYLIIQPNLMPYNPGMVISSATLAANSAHYGFNIANHMVLKSISANQYFASNNVAYGV